MKQLTRIGTSLVVGLFSSTAVFAQFPKVVLSPNVIAEESTQPPFPNSNAIAFDAGEASVFPGASAQAGSIDNVYLQVDENASTDSAYFSLAPRLDYIASGAKQTLWFGYFGNYRQHADAPKADFQDHRLSLVSHTAIDSRRRLDFEASTSQSHQSIGTARTLNFSPAEIDALDEVDTYRINKLGAAFSYGNPSVKGELIGGVAGGSIAFNSNEAETDQYDRDFTVLWSQLYYRLSPRTRVFGNVVLRGLDYERPYDSDGIERDVNTTTVSAGVEWELSGLWFGSVSLRNRQWDYDSPALNDFDSVLADAKLFWLWKPYSRFEFSLFQQQYNSVVGTGLGESNTLGVTWSHEWSDKFSTLIQLQSVSQEETDGSPDTDYSQASAEIRYAPRRWLRVVGGFKNEQIDKSAGNAETTEIYVGAVANL